METKIKKLLKVLAILEKLVIRMISLAGWVILLIKLLTDW